MRPLASRLEAFAERYRVELDTSPALADFQDAHQLHQHNTLIYAGRNPQVNHARVLQAYLKDLEVPEVVAAS